ncbi:DNA circularization N-terminal domain-containing protein [Rhizobium sp. NPDC090275]|uniref:DNA circularization N-terminal domain-containing protein n=1 Tax=Rhizobium sp. NPDC090275 TaxID=3364498 RepID=UPI00383B783C
MRDWAKTLRPASYRGVPFWVDYEDLSGGKRLALHEYAGGKRPVIEELGLMSKSFGVTMYLVSDLADVQALALEAVILADGPGLLIMPMDGGMLATAQDFRRSRAKDKHGYVGFDVTFIPALTAGGIVLSIGDLTATVANGFAAAAAQFAKLF